ncbi:MAG: VOC family protein [Ferruginibacter sp.]
MLENLPKPMLGDVFAITISTPDLDKSFEFYTKLGFSEVFRSDFPFPLIQITDGALLMMLRKDTKSYIALTYYVKDLETVVASLETAGISFFSKPAASDMIKRYIMESPDGFKISLIGYIDGFVQPKGPAMLGMPQQDYFNPEKYVNKVCGMFGEFAHPVKDLDASIAFWDKLGFKAISKFTSPYDWAIISDGLSAVGLHQTNHFDYPAITYFASDMADKIEKIKTNGINNMKEMGKGNAVLITPENQHINLFKMGF